jgi:hypothetical protein
MLIAVDVIFLAGVDRTSPVTDCRVSSLFLLYFLLAAFMVRLISSLLKSKPIGIANTLFLSSIDLVDARGCVFVVSCVRHCHRRQPYRHVPMERIRILGQFWLLELNEEAFLMLQLIVS